MCKELGSCGRYSLLRRYSIFLLPICRSGEASVQVKITAHGYCRMSQQMFLPTLSEVTGDVDVYELLVVALLGFR